MLGVPLETAIVAALIGLAAALLGQFVAVFLGARYAANLNRRTQLELADLAFRRQWRERTVRPFLELANQRLSLLAGFNGAVVGGDLEVALKVAREFGGTDSVVHAAAFGALGDSS